MSVLFDTAARAHLALAYAARGGWAGRPLAAPTMRHRAWALARGINLDGTDWTGRNRWDQAFMRALYYQHRNYWDGETGFREERRMVAADSRALQVEFSPRARRFQAGPRVLYGRGVRIRIRPGGAAAMKAVKAKPLEQRIYDDAGNPAGRWADPAERDWE